MRKCNAILVFVVMAGGFSFTQTPPAPATPHNCEVVGVVSDQYGARIPFANVSIDGALLHQTIPTESDGSYKAQLPCGVYTETLEARGFAQHRRPPFHLAWPYDVRFDVTLNVGVIVDSICVKTDLDGDQRVCPPGNTGYYKTDTLTVPALGDLPKEMFVHHGVRADDATGVRTYRGASSPLSSRVVVEYDTITLTADEVTLDPRTFEVVAQSADVEADGLSGHSVRAKITFVSGTPTITLSTPDRP